MQYRKQLNNSKQNTKNSSKRTNNNKSFEIRDYNTHLPEIASYKTSLRDLEEQERSIDETISSIRSQISPRRTPKNGLKGYDTKSFNFSDNIYDDGIKIKMNSRSKIIDDLDYSPNRFRMRNSTNNVYNSNSAQRVDLAVKLNELKYNSPLNTNLGMVEMLSSMYDYDKHIQRVKRMLNDYDRYYQNDPISPFMDYASESRRQNDTRKALESKESYKTISRSIIRSNESDTRTREDHNYSTISSRKLKNTSDFESFDISELKPDPKRSTQQKNKVKTRKPTEVSPLNVTKNVPKDPYDPVSGFIIFIDFVTNLEASSVTSRIITCVHHPKMGLGEPSVLPIIDCESYKTNGKVTTVALFSTKQPVPRCSPIPNLSLLIEIQIAKKEKTPNNDELRLKSLAWTKIPLFDENKYLRSGSWKQPLLSLPILAETNLTQLKSKPKFGTSEIFYRLVSAKDSQEHSNEPISPLYAKNYKYPLL